MRDGVVFLPILILILICVVVRVRVFVRHTTLNGVSLR